MAKYGKTAQKEVHKQMRERKRRSGAKSRKQAIAIGLNKARKKGAKVPARKD
jgi:hypothetical protein